MGNTYIAAIRNSPLVDDSYNKAADDLQLLARALSSLGRYVPMAGEWSCVAYVFHY